MFDLFNEDTKNKLTRLLEPTSTQFVELERKRTIVDLRHSLVEALGKVENLSTLAERTEEQLTQTMNDVEHIVFDSGGYICGGFPRYIASPSNDPALPTDIDVFVDSKESYFQLNTRLKKYLLSNLSGLELTPRLSKETKYSVTHMFNLLIGLNVQVIKTSSPIKLGTYYGYLIDILESFDFSVVKIALTEPGKGTALATESFSHHEYEKTIVLTGSILNPVASLIRALKYVSKGYTLDIGQTIRIFMAWETYSPEYKSVITRLLSDTLALDGDGVIMHYSPKAKSKEADNELLYEIMFKGVGI